ncbi:hypothetical protein CIB84_014614 [Bambusicola thoracicus]|uniref:Uncharacterized protein n=1 Tax=Bambusicola thoracicus TaxID=9083 RepID=A0A2P4SC12_BAMTH|nr:hypothetical protein CIB84_014614 [Bambusicola thoracicus]
MNWTNSLLPFFFTAKWLRLFFYGVHRHRYYENQVQITDFVLSCSFLPLPDREVITCLSYFLTFFSFSLLGVIAVVIFILLCITAIAIHIYRKKSRYSKTEKKGSENEDSAESALKSELSIQNTASENQKEYFF